MDDHNNYNHDEILSKYWHTDTPSSASDDSRDNEDELITVLLLTDEFFTWVIDQWSITGQWPVYDWGSNFVCK